MLPCVAALCQACLKGFVAAKAPALRLPAFVPIVRRKEPAVGAVFRCAPGAGSPGGPLDPGSGRTTVPADLLRRAVSLQASLHFRELLQLLLLRSAEVRVLESWALGSVPGDRAAVVVVVAQQPAALQSVRRSPVAFAAPATVAA